MSLCKDTSSRRRGTFHAPSFLPIHPMVLCYPSVQRRKSPKRCCADSELMDCILPRSQEEDAGHGTSLVFPLQDRMSPLHPPRIHSHPCWFHRARCPTRSILPPPYETPSSSPFPTSLRTASSARSTSTRGGPSCTSRRSARATLTGGRRR